MRITESPLDEEMLATIQTSAQLAFESLDVDLAASPADVVASLDAWICSWQSGQPPIAMEHEEACLWFGSLWGTQLTHCLQWQWANVTFHDFGDASAAGVFPPDRSLAIYPFHFIHGCIENRAPVTIKLAFDVLVDGRRVPDLPAGGYENVMDHVHHPPTE